MTLKDACRVISAGLGWLPERFNTPQARAMLLAIGLQESRFAHRQQIGGPAHGYFQFERDGGVRGVLGHRATAEMAREVLARMDYSVNAPAAYGAIVHNDSLAVVFARLLLFTVPAALPGPDDVGEGWNQYRWAWRPGKPHRDTWAGFYARAWDYVGKD